MRFAVLLPLCLWLAWLVLVCGWLMHDRRELMAEALRAELANEQLRHELVACGRAW